MADPYIGEIRMFAGNFPPRGWFFCDGELLPIAKYPALFSILGTTYGGDGRTSFALPRLSGSAPLMAGQGSGLTPRNLGAFGGVANVTLTSAQMATHTHAAAASNSAGGQTPANNVWSKAETRGVNQYASALGTAQNMNAGTLAPVGGGQPHNNLMPYQVVSFIIAAEGVYPPRS